MLVHPRLGAGSYLYFVEPYFVAGCLGHFLPSSMAFFMFLANWSME
jgi:hypothetical protein